MLMAVETPAMLPTPTVDASAVDSAWNDVTVPSPPILGPKPNAVRIANGSFRNWMNPVASVNTTPAPMSRTIIGGPQTRAFSLPCHSRKVSIGKAIECLVGTSDGKRNVASRRKTRWKASIKAAATEPRRGAQAGAAAAHAVAQG